MVGSGRRGQRVVVVAAVLAGLVVVARPAQGVVGIPARIVVVAPPVSEATYPAIDYGRRPGPRDDRFADTAWRVVEDTGNCCETYVTVTPDGRLLDFGGSFVHYSDDRGLTWRRVEPLTPLVNGEGAIVVAPGGDVLGVEWDPYSGDHLQSYKFEADTGQWLYTEMPLHQPFYDREWLAVVPGPVIVDGQAYEYVSFIKGGIPKEVWFFSTDGLTYTEVTSKFVEELTGADPVTGPLPVTGVPVNDWAQPNTNGGMFPLGGGDLLAAPDLSSEWAIFDGASFGWAPYRLPDGSEPRGLWQVDSAGRVHNVIPAGTSFQYRISVDGGGTWKAITVPLPADHVIEEIDFRANRAAGVAAVAMRAHDQAAGTDQDLVFKVDITRIAPFLARVHEIGLGDVDATGGVGNDIRLDFASVAVFADGRVAVSFLDSTTMGISPITGEESIAPAIAIEGETTLGRRVPPVPEPPPPQLGGPYVDFTFDGSAEGWAASGVPTWSRSGPGTKTGADDPATASFGIEGPTQYVDNMDAALTSPPIATDAGFAVLQFWLKIDTEDGFDFVNVEWSDGTLWRTLGQFTGRDDDYPAWRLVTLGFESSGGDIRVRFRFTSDLLCSGLTPACGVLFTGARVDEVTIGRQAA